MYRSVPRMIATAWLWSLTAAVLLAWLLSGLMQQQAPFFILLAMLPVVAYLWVAVARLLDEEGW